MINKKLTSFAMDEELDDFLTQRANALHCSKSSVIRMLLALEMRKNVLLPTEDTK